MTKWRERETSVDPSLRLNRPFTMRKTHQPQNVGKRGVGGCFGWPQTPEKKRNSENNDNIQRNIYTQLIITPVRLKSYRKLVCYLFH